MESFDIFAIWRDPKTLFPAEQGDAPAAPGYILLAVTLLLLAGFLFLFFRRFRKGRRGYRECLLMGGAVLAFLFAVEWAVLCLKRYTSGAYVYFDMVLLYETHLPLDAFALALIASNLVLLKKEGVRPRNLLAVLAGVLHICGMYVAFALNVLEARWIGDLFIDVLADVLFLLFLGFFYGLAFTCLVYARHRVKPDRDYIIVLGCAVFGERVPPLLKSRIDTALRFRAAQQKKSGHAPALILSGGKGPGEDISEAEAMYRYCALQGVPETSLIREDASKSTAENFAFSKRIADERFPGGKGAFSTTSFHLFRSEILAREAGLDAEGLSAPTKWYFIPNAFIRELAAAAVLYKKRLLRLLLCGAAVSAAVTVWQWLVIHPGQAPF